MENLQDKDSDVEESGVDTCAICLSRIAADEAFLDNCYHRFHFQCLLSWSKAQSTHPAESGPAYCCPLCKAAYTSILFGLEENTFRQHWVAAEQHSSPSFLQLNPQQLRRRSLYSSSLPAQSASLPGIRKVPVAAAEQHAWVQRELQALTLQDDVNIVTQVVLRSVEALAKASSQGTRINKTSKDISLLSTEQQQEWLSQMTAAVQPFIPDHDVQFASQLLGFLASKLTMQAHDRAVFGDVQSACTPTQLELNHSGDGAEEDSRCCSGSSSSRCTSKNDRDDGGNTDSEGYLPLLQAHSSRQYAPGPWHSMQAEAPSPAQSHLEQCCNTEPISETGPQIDGADTASASNVQADTLRPGSFGSLHQQDTGSQQAEQNSLSAMTDLLRLRPKRKSKHQHRAKYRHKQHRALKSADF